MQLSFRWYGTDDKVTLENIKQIPAMQGIVTAIYDIPVGEVWPLDKIKELQQSVEAQGLTINVIESVPVHEDIKLGKATRDAYIENYIETLQNIGKAKIPVVCYNFMPVFDWIRTDLVYKLDDGSTALAYFERELSTMDPRERSLSLPGWDESYTQEDINELFSEYDKLDEGDLFENYQYFIEKIVPAAEKAGIKLALHPDDPPWSIFGLPRIVTHFDRIKKMMDLHPSEAHGLCVCTGSLGVSKDNNVIEILDYFLEKKKVNFIHARNVKILDSGFTEVAHLSSAGDINMAKVMETVVKYDYQGPLRPDHGRMIWGEEGKAGYGLFDRALGATYLNGLYEAFKIKKEEE